MAEQAAPAPASAFTYWVPPPPPAQEAAADGSGGKQGGKDEGVLSVDSTQPTVVEVRLEGVLALVLG